MLRNTLGTRNKASILKGYANWNSVGESARQRVTICRNNGTISALCHSQSTKARTF